MSLVGWLAAFFAAAFVGLSALMLMPSAFASCAGVSFCPVSVHEYSFCDVVVGGVVDFGGGDVGSFTGVPFALLLLLAIVTVLPGLTCVPPAGLVPVTTLVPGVPFGLAACKPAALMIVVASAA